MFRWREPFKSRLYLYQRGYNRATLLKRVAILALSTALILIGLKINGFLVKDPVIPVLYSLIVGLLIAIFYPLFRGVIPNIVTVNKNGIYFMTGSLKKGRYFYDQIDDFSIKTHKNGKFILEIILKDKRTICFALSDNLSIDDLNNFILTNIHNKYKPEKETPKKFDLSKSRICVIIMVFFAAAFFYAVIDIFYNYEYYAEGRYYSIYAQSAIYSFVLAFIILNIAKVPLLESAFLSLLLGITTGIAAYPGMLRINQITDTKGLIEHTYYPSVQGTLYPEEDGLPILKFKNDCGYWAQFDSNTPYSIPVRLRKGGLGFYQVDFKPIYKDMLKWNPSGRWGCTAKRQGAQLGKKKTK